MDLIRNSYNDSPIGSSDDDKETEENINVSMDETDLQEENEIDVTKSLINLKAKTWEELHELYKKHAYLLGFNFKKSTQRIGREGNIIEKYFTCSCQGFAKEKNNATTTPSPIIDVESTNQNRSRKKREVPITRTGCKASIRIKLNSEGEYEVKHHITEHNHNLTRPAWQHLQRNMRNISEEKGKEIEEMEAAGLKPSDGFRFMVQIAGGEDKVGHTMKDHLNVVNRMRRKTIEAGDAQTVIDILQKKKMEEPDFYYSLKLNDEGKLAALFWRDGMMKEDFILYGDIMIFDTTYTTNKYSLICAPFIGVNNHWNNVMFACAFVADEKTQSFEWLFQKFKESMDGKSPVTIFTDQDLAIAKAVEKEFDKTRHRLCLWHITQNAVSHFGQLKTDTKFKEAFDRCLKGCVNKSEFDERWQYMISTYGLQNQKWFARLYECRDKWCTALNKDFFSAGILSSQRSESTNNAISFNAKKTTSLTQFMQIFDATIERWRSKETVKEARSCNTMAKTSMPKTKLLEHANKVYTMNLYKQFEEEYKASLGTKVGGRFEIGAQILYEVAPEQNEEQIERVYFSSENGNTTVTCSCKHFEEVGLLCFHCIRILNQHSITEIPEQYILKRWTKKAKSEVWDRRLRKEVSLPNTINQTMKWRQEMARTYYNLLLQSETNPNTRRFLEDAIARDIVGIQELLSTSGVEGTNSSAPDGTRSAPAILDPDHSNTKGRKARVKGKFERKGPITDKFGSHNPKPHLF